MSNSNHIIAYKIRTCCLVLSRVKYTYDIAWNKKQCWRNTEVVDILSTCVCASLSILCFRRQIMHGRDLKKDEYLWTFERFLLRLNFASYNKSIDCWELETLYMIKHIWNTHFLLKWTQTSPSVGSNLFYHILPTITQNYHKLPNFTRKYYGVLFHWLWMKRTFLYKCTWRGYSWPAIDLKCASWRHSLLRVRTVSKKTCVIAHV